jgi:1-aminocyclopropane-1-carboxylate deaminase/D-cysteine desulfhydrase-like pyridoxal-dependent ACC family enzyme
MAGGEARPIFRRWPRLRESAPIEELGDLPTPVQRLASLGRAWGLDLWVKREDLTGSEFGGNKVRKLEFLLPDARARAERIWAYAVTGSNWAVAVAHYGRRLGIPVDLLLFKRPLNPYLEKNVALARGLARSTSVTGSVVTVPFRGVAQKLRPGRVYIMPPGGSSPLSTLGYVNAGLELAEQVKRGELPEPDVVVAALGPGGMARRTSALLARRSGDAGAAIRVRAADFEVLHGFIGKGYGIATEAGEAAAAELAEREGLHAESTYTAKALAALRTAAPALAGRRVLFWLTCNSRPVDRLLQ